LGWEFEEVDKTEEVDETEEVEPVMTYEVLPIKIEQL